MKVSCAECSKLFEAKRRGATFCSVTCRQRASRRDRESPKSEKTASITPISPPEPAETGLVAETRRALEEAEALATVQGQAALLLAQRLERAVDTGSAMASLARQLSAAMTEALAAGTPKADALDELAVRRRNKAAG